VHGGWERFDRSGSAKPASELQVNVEILFLLSFISSFAIVLVLALLFNAAGDFIESVSWLWTPSEIPQRLAKLQAPPVFSLHRLLITFTPSLHLLGGN
jgi:hypothetical protein